MIRKPEPNDLAVWPDGTWCFFEDINEYRDMLDDYRVIDPDSDEAQEILGEA